MARAFRGRPDLYFGKPGYMSKLPWPRGGMEKTYDRPTFDFVTGSGQHQVSMLSTGSRPYTLTWNAGHVDTFKVLEQYWTGTMGTGPWALMDPSATNLLIPNVAAASSSTYDTRGWKTSGAADQGVPLSNLDPDYIHRTGAPRSIRWNFTGAVGLTPTLFFDVTYRTWKGIPVVGGLSYAWSFWGRTAGFGASDVQIYARIQWRNATGGSIGISTGTIAYVGFWTRLSIIANAPSDAVYAEPQIIANQGPLIAGSNLYIDEPLFEQDTIVNDWAPGTGLRPVEILSLTDTVPFDARFREGVAMTLRELAR